MDDRPPVPDVLRWRIGDVTIDRVEPRVVAVPHGAISSDMPPEVVDAERPWIDPFLTDDGRMRLSIHSFVVHSGTTTIVVDTCVGDHGDRPLPPDPDFADRLDGAIEGGLAGVDVVVCTHLHVDHVGWNTRRDEGGRLVPTFPNARYLVTRADLDDLVHHDHHDLLTTSIEPVRRSGQLVPVDVDHRITSDVHLFPTPGHTPGHVSVLVQSGGATAVITGDVAHSPLQLVHPHVAADRFDDDAVAATITRTALVDRLITSDAVVFGTHFPPPTAGRLRRDAGGVARFEPCSGQPIGASA